eukprot:c26221_g1_i4 orf=106-291(+)
MHPPLLSLFVTPLSIRPPTTSFLYLHLFFPCTSLLDFVCNSFDTINGGLVYSWNDILLLLP